MGPCVSPSLDPIGLVYKIGKQCFTGFRLGDNTAQERCCILPNRALPLLLYSKGATWLPNVVTSEFGKKDSEI